MRPTRCKGGEDAAHASPPLPAARDGVNIVFRPRPSCFRDKATRARARPRSHRDVGPAVNRKRQNLAAIIVRMLAYEVHPSWGRGNHIRLGAVHLSKVL